MKETYKGKQHREQRKHKMAVGLPPQYPHFVIATDNYRWNDSELLKKLKRELIRQIISTQTDAV